MIQKEERIGGGRDDVAYYPAKHLSPWSPAARSRGERECMKTTPRTLSPAVSVSRLNYTGSAYYPPLNYSPLTAKIAPRCHPSFPPGFLVCHTVIVSTASTVHSTVVTRWMISLFYGKFILPPDAYSLWLQKKLHGNRFIPMVLCWKNFLKLQLNKVSNKNYVSSNEYEVTLSTYITKVTSAIGMNASNVSQRL